MKAYIKDGLVYVKKTREKTFFNSTRHRLGYKLIVVYSSVIGIKFEISELDEILMKLAFLNPDEIGSKRKDEIEYKIKFKANLISVLIPLQREITERTAKMKEGKNESLC